MQPEPNCKFEAGVMVPAINREKCEAKGPCVPACPYDVLAILPVPKEDRKSLSLIGKLKLMAHGGKQAYAVNQGACHGCGHACRRVRSTRSRCGGLELP